MPRMEGKVAIVTGGSRGLGRAAVSALAAEGAAVVVADILEDEGNATVRDIASAGGRARFARLDVRDPEAWKAVVDETVSAFGGLDVLVNNAGVTLPRTIDRATLEEFRNVMDINLYGPFLGMQAVLPALIDRGSGSIINVSSNSTEMIVPTTTYYAASKAAVANLTKTAAVHFATQGHGIRVNSVHPGPHATEMVDDSVPHIRQMRDTIPLGRFGRPDEFGQLVLFLASDDSSYITAEEFFTDGGLSRVSYAVGRG
jgi:3alpha(or 20beta)-hydroxysteroid dehydrogenase